MEQLFTRLRHGGARTRGGAARSRSARRTRGRQADARRDGAGTTRPRRSTDRVARFAVGPADDGRHRPFPDGGDAGRTGRPARSRAAPAGPGRASQPRRPHRRRPQGAPLPVDAAAGEHALRHPAGGGPGLPRRARGTALGLCRRAAALRALPRADDRGDLSAGAGLRGGSGLVGHAVDAGTRGDARGAEQQLPRTLALRRQHWHVGLVARRRSHVLDGALGAARPPALDAGHGHTPRAGQAHSPTGDPRHPAGRPAGARRTHAPAPATGFRQCRRGRHAGAGPCRGAFDRRLLRPAGLAGPAAGSGRCRTAVR